jgi:hypothetical protein
MDHQILICSCGSPQHQLILSTDNDPGEEEDVYLNIHLCKKSLWARVKYLLGYQSVFGAFEEVVLSKKELQEAVNKL